MRRILIFDPQPDISALLELVVRRLGHEVVLGSALGAALPRAPTRIQV